MFLGYYHFDFFHHCFNWNIYTNSGPQDSETIYSEPWLKTLLVWRFQKVLILNVHPNSLLLEIRGLSFSIEVSIGSCKNPPDFFFMKQLLFFVVKKIQKKRYLYWFILTFKLNFSELTGLIFSIKMSIEQYTLLRVELIAELLIESLASESWMAESSEKLLLTLTYIVAQFNFITGLISSIHV